MIKEMFKSGANPVFKVIFLDLAFILYFTPLVGSDVLMM
jgi:hypothetical protein